MRSQAMCTPFRILIQFRFSRHGSRARRKGCGRSLFPEIFFTYGHPQRRARGRLRLAQSTCGYVYEVLREVEPELTRRRASSALRLVRISPDRLPGVGGR